MHMHEHILYIHTGVFELIDIDGKKLCDEVQEFQKLEKSMEHMRIEPDMQVCACMFMHVCICMYVYGAYAN
jgi:hypothetical protein